MNERKTLWGRIKAYKLDTQVIIGIVLTIIVIISVVLYLQPSFQKNEVLQNIVLALFTSLLVSIFTIFVDVITEFNKDKHDKYLESLRAFGIGNLYMNKQDLLKDLLHDCDSKLWVSGYRLIMTYNLRNEIYEAVKRGAVFRGVICPPWTDAFKMVYGTNEKVIDNYIEVFHQIHKACAERGISDSNNCVVFVNKPIFNDTYRIDQQLITGPYMHNKDEHYNRLMAKDFFSYDIIRDSKLNKLMNDEYETLFSEAETKLDWEKFEEVYADIKNSDYRESEKIEHFLSALTKVSGEESI